MTQTLLAPPSVSKAPVPAAPVDALPPPAIVPGNTARSGGLVLLENISWKTYCAILEDIGDSAIRLTYDRGLLEIEMPSSHHEMIKDFLAHLIATTLDALEIDYIGVGSTTWRREDLQRGAEPDTCFYIRHATQLRGRVDLDLNTDPPPDLVIEIDHSHSTINKMDLYEALGIPEIWRIRTDGSIDIMFRDEAGKYQSAPASAAVPQMTLPIIHEYIRLRTELGNGAAVRRFRKEVLGR